MGAKILGIDFDNTLVNYDGVFHRAAVDLGLIDNRAGTSKEAVKAVLIGQGREDEWTALQGEVYGARMDLAKLFDGARDALHHLLRQGVGLRIISHKTRYPFRGTQHDLHAAARSFLTSSGIVGDLVAPQHVHFELTIAAKLNRIAEERCTAFLDDLPEILGHANFPAGVAQILFDPGGTVSETAFDKIRRWDEISVRVLDA